MAAGGHWEHRVAAGAKALLSYSQEELLAILKCTLPDRLEVLQNVVDWAVPDLVYGSARGLLDARYNGIVKSVSEKNGYGFISDPSITEAFGADLFVHARQLRGICPGTEVNFAILLNKGKPHAYDVMASEAVAHPSAGVGFVSRPSAATQGAAPAPQWARKGADWGQPFAEAGWSPSKASAKGSHSPGWSPLVTAHSKSSVGAKGVWTGDVAGKSFGKGKMFDSAAGKSFGGKASPTGGKTSVGKGSLAVGTWDSSTSNNTNQGKEKGVGKALAISGYAFNGEAPTSAVEMSGVTDRRFSGFVKSFKQDKFGFLTCAELQAIHSEQDIYVHWNHVKECNVGDPVTFAVILNEKGGLKAVDLVQGSDHADTKRARKK